MITEVLRHDLFDLVKVNVPSVSAIIAVKNNILDFLIGDGKEIIIVLILCTILAYNLFKLGKMIREMKWDKQDRLDEKE